MVPLSSASRCRSLVAIVMVAGFCSMASTGAQTPALPEGAVAEIRSVKFATVRAPGSGGSWLEATVEVGVTAASATGSAARFADRVLVTLNVSLGSQEGGFFRSAAEAVSLEAGRAVFRFYLPPEILRREQVNTDPFAYAAELAVRGRPVAVSPGAVSSVVRSAEALRAFKDRVARAAPLNDGILVPQYLSPFAALYAADTPSFVRLER